MKSTTIILDGGRVEPGSVGGKGFALNRLIEMGTRVPPTGAITTDGYRWFIAHSGLDRFIEDLRKEGLPDQADLDRATERIDEAFLEAAMPQALADAICRLAHAVAAGGLLAIRSSATTEDMATASFAGQYRSYLEIADDAALLRAVRLVWASLWLPAPRAYRVHSGVPEDDLAMSVVVMRLVDAERAGVVFTVNPTGSPRDLRIEAVAGLAEQLVSGDVTPEAYVVPRSAPHHPTVDRVLNEAIEAALDLERRFGAPQDVEWAHDGEHMYIVQSRPITTIPREATDDGFDSVIGPDDSFTTAGIAESLPGVLPPLQWTTASPLFENGFRQLFDQLKTLPPAADRQPFLARIRGRAVLSLDLMKAAAAEVPGGSAAEIERQYFGRVISESADPPPDSASQGPFSGLRSILMGFREINARRRFRFEANACIDTTQRLLLDPFDFAGATDSQLLAYRHRVLDLAGRLVAAEIAVAAAAAAAYRGVELFLESHLGEEAPRLAQQLTAGELSPCGAQVALHTCDLAEQVLANPDLVTAVGAFAERDPEIFATLEHSASGAELHAAFERELRRSGSVSVFAGPTWAESPDLAWQLIGQTVQVHRSGRMDTTDSGDRSRLLADVESRLSDSWKWRFQRVITGQIVDVRRRLLRRLVSDTVEFLHLREKTKSAVLALGGEIRRVHLALGHRLYTSGVLTTLLDVDLLGANELEPALKGRGPSTWELERRRAALERLSKGGSVPQVFVGNPDRSLGDASAATGDTFTGWGASSGIYEGNARIITKATESIESGDILVARTTDPAWTPLFLTAGAIVVEEGGPLSHAAIIARELGLPAVLNVPGLLGRLAEQESVRLRVDGTAGIVTIVGAEHDAEPDRAMEAAA